jgi:hypothetical protein
VLIYQSEAFRKVIPDTTESLEKLGCARIKWQNAINGEEFRPELAGQEQCLHSLRHMREQMFDRTNPVAMVAIGGMEGVVREARLFLEMTTHSVYVCSSTEGAASRLRPCLEQNLLEDPDPIRAPNWRERIHHVEERFQPSAWKAGDPDLPRAPYALLMQRVVAEVASRL